MKIVFICTNYGLYKDGIGHYVYNLKKEMCKNKKCEIKIISGDTTQKKGKEKFFSKIMYNSINEFLKNELNFIDKDTYFIIEYPFLEWNPIIISSIKKLRKICNLKNGKIILSIHEYKRVHKIRKKFIDLLIKLSDALMVTDYETKKILLNKNKPILIRGIPSNIQRINKPIKNKDNIFCFFGLINKSKAFNEMIEAWKIFDEKDYKLNIYTSSDINILNSEKNKINIFKELSDQELSKELWKCKYAILPIKPQISMNNATLKAVAQHECIPIGIFEDNNTSDLGINIEDEFYSKENILEALKKTVNLEKDEYLRKINLLNKFSEKFSFKKNSNDILDFLEKVI
ncbi:glycosyltransferase [Clostridium perfringens]|uniref:glycosyltransferase n=1 Tax=Clostridium perfringens TaxID=1502 RepID=UPI000D712269|nr:glycosyltransferase [Clostridium perfringens]PWX68718.1 hypothetical protein CYK74_14070 [Clostridium perfringens]